MEIIFINLNRIVTVTNISRHKLIILTKVSHNLYIIKQVIVLNYLLHSFWLPRSPIGFFSDARYIERPVKGTHYYSSCLLFISFHILWYKYYWVIMHFKINYNTFFNVTTYNINPKKNLIPYKYTSKSTSGMYISRYCF